MYHSIIIILSEILIFLSPSILSFVISPKVGGCTIDITQLDPEPIVVTSDTLEFLYPEPDALSSFVTIAADDTITIACPGGTLTIGGNTYNSVSATCISENNFNVDDNTISFASITCSRQPFHVARYTGESCELGGRQAEIGYVVDENNDGFVRQITLCFDDIAQTTLYSQYHLTKSIGHHESGVPRPSFIEDDFYNFGGTSVNSLYTRQVQRTTINSLLGLPADSTKYVTDNGNYFLSRGHFTAKADFVYAPQQRATFHFVNVAPQWQTFNGDNWNTVEEDVRGYAEANGVDLDVYTGSYGVATLPHEETGEETELYLYLASDGSSKGLPVPKLYWKVVYNPDTKAGIALIGVNNPYQTDLTSSIICTDVSDSVDWLNWKKDDVEAGFSYACEVDALRETVKQLPELEVTGLLV